ncbi:hypothetical protein [Peribacillus muralis]|uniref:hypothetical protein n=1 Tax=Peribacillus muralis TaxID=264697 RepID=UPI00366BDE71
MFRIRSVDNLDDGGCLLFLFLYLERFIPLCVDTKMGLPLPTVLTNSTITVPLHCRHSLSEGGP